MPVLSGRFEWNAGPIREVDILRKGAFTLLPGGQYAFGY